MTEKAVKSNACFFLFSTQLIGEDTIHKLTSEHPEYVERLITSKSNGLGGGNACILNPEGDIISNVLAENQEGIVTAEIDLAEIGIANFFGDTTGHYCNPAVHLEVENEKKSVVRFGAEKENYAITFAEIMKGGRSYVS